MIFITSGIFAQQTSQNATIYGSAANMKIVPSLATQIEAGTFIPAIDIKKEYNPKKRGANIAVPGKGLPLGEDPLVEIQRNTSRMSTPDLLLSYDAASSGSNPTDPTGAVGPNHYVNAWNSSFRIWDKAGNPLTEAASLGTIFPGETSGDPIVMYDQFADRFIITEFTFKNGFLVAISQGPDPVNDGWYTYEFLVDAFPDYPKFSLWSDGYYITANKSSGSADSKEVVFAIERDEIIVGNSDAQFVGFPLPGIRTSGFYSPLGFNVNGTKLPALGNAPVVFMQDDAWSGIQNDHLKLWTINVDWTDVAGSTISNPDLITTEPFDGLFDGGDFSNLPQPSGPDLDALQAAIMYMAQYRKFGSFNSAVFNFVVDVDGNDDHAGIRWYELRQDKDGDPWTIFQEGTYLQPDGHSAYCGSMCIDLDGNIAMAYSVVSNTQYPSLRFTGRYFADSLGVMTVEEGTIVEGTNSDPSFRYGDYSQMTIDPVDDKTFWSIAEYFGGGSRLNRVGVFKLAPDFANDVGVIDIVRPTNGLLTNSDSVSIVVRNYGIDSQVDVPVHYRIDENIVITDTIRDTLLGSSSQLFTFLTTGDFSTEGATYQITSFTSLEGDQGTSNDTLVSSVTHLYANDLSISAIITPQSGSDLTDEEPITIAIKNYGGASQTEFDVTYSFNNGLPVTEQIPGPLESLTSMEYTFTTTEDFFNLGEYLIEANTSLANDADVTNDTIIQIIESTLCQPYSDCSQGDGIRRLQLGSVDNTSGCDPGGYGDYTYLVAETEMGPFNDLTITTNYGDQHVKVWIDFNDNFLFEFDEIVVEDFVIAPGNGPGNFTETVIFNIRIDANLGEHLMRVKTSWESEVPDNACESTDYGETEDYTVIVSPLTGLPDKRMDESKMTISRSGDDQFFVQYAPVEFDQTLIVTVHNISGQKLISNRVEKMNGKYEFRFDMSYAKPGVYLVRLGDNTFGKVKRIMVD